MHPLLYGTRPHNPRLMDVFTENLLVWPREQHADVAAGKDKKGGLIWVKMLTPLSSWVG